MWRGEKEHLEEDPSRFIGKMLFRFCQEQEKKKQKKVDEVKKKLEYWMNESAESSSYFSSCNDQDNILGNPLSQ